MKHFAILVCLWILSSTTLAETERVEQFSNDQVTVWETIIYPGTNEKLSMHRHDNNRVLVALDDGILEVTNDKKEKHLLQVSKNKTYFLEKDVPGEKHTDVNITDHPMRFIVIELKE